MVRRSKTPLNNEGLTANPPQAPFVKREVFIIPQFIKVDQGDFILNVKLPTEQ